MFSGASVNVITEWKTNLFVFFDGLYVFCNTSRNIESEIEPSRVYPLGNMERRTLIRSGL